MDQKNLEFGKYTHDLENLDTYFVYKFSNDCI